MSAWLGGHAFTVASHPLNKDGLSTLINCLVISDMTCARRVVEARASANHVVGILEQVSGKREKRTVQLSAYWIAKRFDVISLQRTCESCTDDVLAKTIDGMITDLAKLAPAINGQIHVTSDPPGVTAMIDHETIGPTPFDHPVSFGSHTITLVKDGKPVGEKVVEVAPEATVEVVIPVRVEPPPPPPVRIVEHHRSRTLPAIVIGVGVAGIVTGSVLYATGGPTGEAYTFKDKRPAGIGVAAGGALVALIGTIWFVKRGGTTSSPDVAITPGGAYVGWAGSF